MKIGRYDNNRLGLIEGDQVKDVTEALACLPAVTYPYPDHDPLVAHLDQVCTHIRRLAPHAKSLPVDGRHWLPPVASPGKIVAAPVNYQKHLDEARDSADIHFNSKVVEIQTIGMFLKATSSLVGAGAGVALQHLDRRNDHEAELVLIIGKPGRNIARADALQHVAAYTTGLDMTVRGPEERSMRKSIDSFSVLGPWLVTADELSDASQLDFSLWVNGELRQQANTRDLILDIPHLIEFASSYYTLRTGDLLYTGTPEGVSQVHPGDIITTEFAGIGRMDVAVRAARPN